MTTCVVISYMYLHINVLEVTKQLTCMKCTRCTWNHSLLSISKLYLWVLELVHASCLVAYMSVA